MATSIPSLNYVNYSFTDLVAQLQAVMVSTEISTDLWESSTGQMLLEFYAYVANMLLYMTERTAEEAYIQTAQRKSSILNLVSLLNYTPRRASSAQGNVTFTLAGALDNDVIIPAGTNLSTTTGYNYVTVNDAIMFAGQTSLVVAVIQGTWIELDFVSSGEVNQEYSIDDTAVENDNLLLYVDEVLWEVVSSFTNSVNVDNHYKIDSQLDDTLIIKLGDGVFGKSPLLSSEILIKYLQSDGLEGNVYSVGLLTQIGDTIYDSEDNAITTLSVTNSSSILGGDIAETLEEVRENAPKVFSTGDRLVTKADYNAVIEAYPSVASVYCWGEAEETSPNVDNYNQVKISLILQDWQLPSTDFKTTLGIFLQTKAQLTVRYAWVDPTIVNVVPDVVALVSSNYSLTAIQAAIEVVFAEQFALGDTAKIGTSIRYAAVISAIQAITGIAYCYLTLNVSIALEEEYDETYDYGMTVPLLEVIPLTARIYEDDVLVASDDGEGAWITSNSDYTVSAGEIDYETGVLGITLDPTPTGTLTVRYQQDEEGDLVVDKSQILSYLKSNQTVSYVS